MRVENPDQIHPGGPRILSASAVGSLKQEYKPLDIVVVLDRSGSMSGEPLDSVTRATAQLLRLAGADEGGLSRATVIPLRSFQTLVSRKRPQGVRKVN